MVSLVEAGSSSGTTAPDPIDGVIARLEDPRTAESLHQLIDHLDLLAVLVVGLDQLVGRGDTIADSIGAGLAELRSVQKPPVDVAQLLAMGRQFTDAAPALLDFLPVVERIASSDLGDPRLTDLAATVARAAIRGSADGAAVPVSGIRSLLRMLKDEDVSRALGFVFGIAKALGQELKPAEAKPAATR